MPAPAALGLALVAGGALGAAAGFSPFAVGAIGAAAWVRLAKGGSLRAALGRWDRQMRVVLGVWCGAACALSWPLIWSAALLFAVRVVARWITLRRLPSTPDGLVRPLAFSTIAQGPVALAAGLGFALAAQGTGAGTGDGVLSTIVLSVVLAQAIALVAARPAPSAPLTQRPVAAELSAGP